MDITGLQLRAVKEEMLLEKPKPTEPDMPTVAVHETIHHRDGSGDEVIVEMVVVAEVMIGGEHQAEWWEW